MKNLFLTIAIPLLSSCLTGNGSGPSPSQADTVLKPKRDSDIPALSDLHDTTKIQRHIPPEINEEAMQRAVISKRDSSFSVYNNIRADYRIIGYESPDTNARKMVLFSVFTSDVQDNPFQCPYGSYYDSAQGEKLIIKYIGENGSFIEASITGSEKNPATVYFQKKWVEFD